MMNQLDRGLLNSILRQDFPSFVEKTFRTLSPGQTFVPEWYISAIAYELERVRRGEIKRLIINLPPRSLKSIMTSVAFPAFILGHDPARRIICTSYSAELAQKHSNDFRALLEAPWYRELFPGTRIGRFKDSAIEIELTRRGGRLATSTNGTVTGRGGGIIIIDDPLKPVDALSETMRNRANEWFRNTLLSRLDDKRTGAIIIVMQRVHMDDLTGFVLEQSDDWMVLNLPAIAESFQTIPMTMGRFHERRPGEVLSPEREPFEVLEELRRQLGSDLFSAQYQQMPVPPGGAMIKKAWIRRYTEAPRATFVVQSWDTASKGGPENDWSVCTTWIDTDDCQLYLLDVLRCRLDYPRLKTTMQQHSIKWNARKVLVEDAGIGTGLIAELRYKIPGVIGIKPQYDKETRMSMASGLIEAGQVHLPERASWLAELETELFSFPGSRHDDQVDSISQMLNYSRTSKVWKWRRFAHVRI
jgi:predicted phage terminase large subunit-like protein